jgi:hypothetical protein
MQQQKAGQRPSCWRARAWPGDLVEICGKHTAEHGAALTLRHRRRGRAERAHDGVCVVFALRGHAHNANGISTLDRSR